MSENQNTSIPNPSILPTEALKFVMSVGPASTALCRGATTASTIREALTTGVPVRDAVLKCVHEASADNSILLGEFLMHYMGMLLERAAYHARPMQRDCSGQDLAQSIYKDLLPTISELDFQSEPAFLSLLLTRLGWKAGDHQRRSRTERRREDLRVDYDATHETFEGNGPSSPSILSSKEELEALMGRVGELKPRDRTLLNLFLGGKSALQVGEYLGISSDAARKRLERLRERLEPHGLQPTT